MTQSKEDTSLYCLLYSVVVLSSEQPQYNYWLSTVVVVDEGIRMLYGTTGGADGVP